MHARTIRSPMMKSPSVRAHTPDEPGVSADRVMVTPVDRPQCFISRPEHGCSDLAVAKPFDPHWHLRVLKRLVSYILAGAVINLLVGLLDDAEHHHKPTSDLESSARQSLALESKRLAFSWLQQLTLAAVVNVFPFATPQRSAGKTLHI
jgi:hypothetical protein